MQLHYFPGNASMTPHMLLEELACCTSACWSTARTTPSVRPLYLALNLNGKIPVLVDGALVLYETAAIVLHLVDTHLQARLALAVGTAERAVFWWLMWLSNTLQAEMPLYF